MDTTTIATCVACKTPVRPNKTRCDKCRAKRLDWLLDKRLRTMAAHEPTKVSDYALYLTTVNTRNRAPYAQYVNTRRP